jgi:hypothetical protein
MLGWSEKACLGGQVYGGHLSASERRGRDGGGHQLNVGHRSTLVVSMATDAWT